MVFENTPGTISYGKTYQEEMSTTPVVADPETFGQAFIYAFPAVVTRKPEPSIV